MFLWGLVIVQDQAEESHSERKSGILLAGRLHYVHTQRLFDWKSKKGSRHYLHQVRITVWVKLFSEGGRQRLVVIEQNGRRSYT